MKLGKLKFENHLTITLKRQVKELKADNHFKEETLATIRRSIKSTRMQEMEVEMKMYIDECTRLRHIVEEVIKSRDPLSDP
jgi:hypothetical protein